MTQSLDIEDALQIIDGYGFHVRDVGLLASALARPGAAVLGTDAYPGLAMKAAALLESVARFDALVDGSRRTAWTLMVPFLWISGYKHDFASDVGFDLVLGVASGSIGLEQSAKVIASHIVLR